MMVIWSRMELRRDIRVILGLLAVVAVEHLVAVVKHLGVVLEHLVLAEAAVVE